MSASHESNSNDDVVGAVVILLAIAQLGCLTMLSLVGLQAATGRDPRIATGLEVGALLMPSIALAAAAFALIRRYRVAVHAFGALTLVFAFLAPWSFASLPRGTVRPLSVKRVVAAAGVGSMLAFPVAIGALGGLHLRARRRRRLAA